MKTITLFSDSASRTKEIGVILGAYLRSGDVLALQGPLGAGKTTLAKGLARGLGVRSERNVSSPTYVLIHEYQGREKIFHLDWYRLRKVSGVDEDMALECFQSPAVTWVEWPERGKHLLPPGTWKVTIDHAGEGRRKLKIQWPSKHV